MSETAEMVDVYPPRPASTSLEADLKALEMLHIMCGGDRPGGKGGLKNYEECKQKLREKWLKT